MYCIVLTVKYVSLLVQCCFCFCYSFLESLALVILIVICLMVYCMHRSVVVSAGLLRIFGQEVAELPLVATSREHQGKVSTFMVFKNALV
jgi:hypothetical protein